MMSAVLTMGLAACNNDDRTALDNNSGMRGADNVAFDNRNNRDNGFLNVGNGRDDGIDHNGPLTEDYTNNDNSDSDLDRGRTYRGTTRDDYLYNVSNDRDGRTRNQITRDRGQGITGVNNKRNDYNNRITRNMGNYNDNAAGNTRNTGDNVGTRNVTNNNNNQASDISADSTTINSKKFPHTRAIVVQHAKYKYIPFGSIQGRIYQFGVPKQGQTQQQAPNQGTAPQAPTGQQAAPAPTAPAPAAPAPQPAAPAKQQQAAPAPATGEAGQFVQQVIDLTNQQRAKNGLPALKADTQLSGVAQKKSQDMAQNNYFSHTSPTYGSPFDMMRDFGVSYKSAGENIAQGQRTPQEVVNAWMNSEGHRKNILSNNFTHIGVGYVTDGHHWTQMFIGK